MHPRHHFRRGSAPLKGLLAALLVPVLTLSGSGAPAVAADPGGPVAAPAADASSELGSWAVEQSGIDSWQVSWRSPRRLPVTSDRPTIVPSDPAAAQASGTEVGVPTVGEDGRTVEATVVSTAPPVPAELDVVLSGQSLDAAATAAPRLGSARWTEPTRELLPADPAEPGSLPVTTQDYELDGIELPGMPEVVEMVGHVVKPAAEVASGDHPLVVFLHGRHSYCYNPANDRLTWAWPCRGAQEPVPSQLGYDYVQRTLASQGYVTVSIAANGINAQDGELADGGAAARSTLLQAHLGRWAAWEADGTHDVDLSNVVLVGHSRGGEGVARAALEIPLDAGYRVAGQVLVAPTDFSRQTTPYVPTVTVLPYCDGDVSDLQGQAYTDVSRDIASDDTSMKSSVMVVGANHNFFNTEWTPGISAAPSQDDWWSDQGVCSRGSDTRLPAKKQRRVARAYIAGAVRLFASADDRFAPMYDGSAVRVASTKDAVVLSHMLGGGRELRRPGQGAELTVPSDATTLLCNGVTGFRSRPGQCGRFAEELQATPHWPATDPQTPSEPAFEMTWQRTGGVGGLSFTTPVDLTGSASMDLRAVVDPKLGDVRVEVRVTDQAGNSTQVVPTSDGGVVPALPRGPSWFPGKYWAQNLRIATADLSGIDSSAVSRVELVAMSARGRVWVLDVAATPAALPVVPARRIALVDLGSLRTDEGGDGPKVAEIPYTVTGNLTAPAQFRVYAMDYFESRRRRIDVEVPAGSSGGSVGWEYTGNARDSLAKVVHSLTGYGIGNVIVRDYQGQVVIVDDDQAPRATLRRASRATAEGKSAIWELALSEPVDYELVVVLEVVAGGAAEPARADDIRRRWLDQWSWVPPGRNPPLHRADQGFFVSLKPGRSTLRVGVPIRQDQRVERRESLTMVARAAELGWRSDPVTVYLRRGR